jgi:hypothetical protein
MALNFSVMSVNERQRKTYGKTIFRFFTTSCDPYMGHTLSFLHISPKKGHKGWLLRKLPQP